MGWFAEPLSLWLAPVGTQVDHYGPQWLKAISPGCTHGCDAMRNRDIEVLLEAETFDRLLRPDSEVGHYWPQLQFYVALGRQRSSADGTAAPRGDRGARVGLSSGRFKSSLAYMERYVLTG